MLKVHVDPPAHLSRAMFRVSAALRRYAPDSVRFVAATEADLRVLHVVSLDAIPYAETLGCDYAVIQYCYASAGEGWWDPLWNGAKAVWSYYPLPTDKLYQMPLGIDAAFTLPYEEQPRPIGVMTTGYVTGPRAEAIEEVYLAARRLGQEVVHLGPMPVGFQTPPKTFWTMIHDVSDERLAAHYRAARYVSGLRYVEGFELPVIEGLACGARPIVFDRADMRRWYDGHALFVPECDGEELVRHITEILSRTPQSVTDSERTAVVDTFSWGPIIKGFWERAVGANGDGA